MVYKVVQVVNLSVVYTINFYAIRLYNESDYLLHLLIDE